MVINHCRDIQRFRFGHPKVPIEELAGTLVSRQEYENGMFPENL